MTTENDGSVMAKNGLDKWFKQKWVDIGSKRKDGSWPLQNVVVQNKRKMRNGSIQNASHLQKPHG